MDALKRFEAMIEGLVEDSMAGAATGHLEPVEIAKRLARAMDSGQTIAAGKTLAPNAFTVLLSRPDYALVAPFRASLETELAIYLRATARERGLTLLAGLRVRIMEDANVRPRKLRVSALISDPGLEMQVPEGLEAQHTLPLPLAEVAASLQLTAEVDTADGRTVPLRAPVTSIGRSLDNDIVIEDNRVSRRHAQIRVQHGAFCLYDLASANGTRVNGLPADKVVLRDGDSISLGGVILAFHSAHQETHRAA